MPYIRRSWDILALTYAGRPKEGIEYLNKGIRLDPRSRYGYLINLGMAHFKRGQVCSWLILIFRPSLWILSLGVLTADGSAGFSQPNRFASSSRIQPARAKIKGSFCPPLFYLPILFLVLPISFSTTPLLALGFDLNRFRRSDDDSRHVSVDQDQFSGVPLPPGRFREKELNG